MKFIQIWKDWGLESLIFLLFVIIILPYGAGVTFDSISFFQAGDNFWSQGRYVHFAANGELEFAAHRFPLYSLLLALFNFSSIGIVIFQTAIFGGFLLAFRSFLNGLKAPKYLLLFLVSLPIILNFYCLWTEGLYAFLFFFLLIQLKKEDGFQSAFWIAILITGLCLTKMVGLVVVFALLIAYSFEKRALRGLLLLGVGVTIIVIWTWLGAYHLGETARTFEMRTFEWSELSFIASELGSWLTPAKYVVIPLITGICLLVFPFFLILKAIRYREEVGVLGWFLFVHFYGYLAFIVASKLFIDASIPFDFRTLFPIIINVIAILAWFHSSSVPSEKSKERASYLLPKIVILIVVLNAYGLFNLRENGVGYNSKSYRDYAFIEVLKALPNELVYTNDQSAISYFSPQISKPILLPEKMNLYTKEKNKTYSAEMDLMMLDLTENQNSKIIWIRNGITESIYIDYEELKTSSSFKVIFDDWVCLILESNGGVEE